MFKEVVTRDICLSPILEKVGMGCTFPSEIHLDCCAPSFIIFHLSFGKGSALYPTFIRISRGSPIQRVRLVKKSPRNLAWGSSSPSLTLFGSDAPVFDPTLQEDILISMLMRLVFRLICPVGR